MGFKLRPGTSVFGNVTFTPGTNENYVAPPTHGSVNVALTATSTASTHISDRPPSLAHDGIIGISDTDGSTISNLNAWVTTGEGVGAWMQLDWSTPQTVNKIKLYDRPNVTHDHIKGGTLTFSDGSSVTVGELPDGVVNGAPDPLEVTFDAKTITWVRFTVDAFTGHNAGLTEFEVWSVLAAPEPATEQESLVELYLNATDSGVVDSSSNSHAVTINGDVSVVAASPYGTGKSMTFDGSGDYLSVDLGADLIASNTPFTAEFWMYPKNISNRGVLHFTNNPGTLETTLYISSAGNLSWFDARVGGVGVGDITPNSGGGIATNEWHHIALTRQSDNYVRIYVDGQLYNTSPDISRIWDLGLSRYLEIGRYANTAYFDGYVSDLRIVKGTAVYTENFSVPTEPVGDYTVAVESPAPAPSYDPAGSWSPSVGNAANMFDGDLTTPAGGVHLIGWPSGSDRWTYTFDTPVTVTSSFRIHATIGGGSGQASGATETFVINGLDATQLAKDQNAYHSGSNPSVWIDMTSIIENGTLDTITLYPVSGVSNPQIMAIEVDGQILTA